MGAVLLRVAGTLAFSSMAYGVSLAAMDRMLQIADGSSWWYLPFATSLGALAGGFAFMFRRTQRARGEIWLAFVVTVPFALAVDIIIAVVNSCSHGVCL